MRDFVLLVTLALFLSGCATDPPSARPQSTTAAETSDGGLGEPEQRLSFLCRSLDNSPDVLLSSLEEVWAAPNYLRMDSCEVSYVGPEPFRPTAEEAAAMAIAHPGAPNAPGGLEAYLTAVGLCTRVSDEAAPSGFGGARKEFLRAAVRICPEGPQGKIIQAWADGSRVGDGRHVVGDSIDSGKFVLVKPTAAPEAEACTWNVAGVEGRILDQKGPATVRDEVMLETGQVFTSDKCGIWGKID